MSTPSLSSGVGTGFGTATAGVPWAPTCPSTVNPGDILLALISARNITTNPVTPVGWTLLDGPRSNGTGRAWLFGKIADGTEDSAAISFGTAVSALNQSGQIFRVIGNNYTGQTITDVVLGFTSTNGTGAVVNDADITTPINNCLALQFLKVDDNNTVGDFAGETGGDWLEGPVEYTNNLSTGVTLQCQFYPMNTAGTIGGGTLTQSAADPWVVIGCYIREPLSVRTGFAVLSGGGHLTGLAGTLLIEGVLLHGGGSIVTTGGRVVVVRSGTALIHGGGTLSATGNKVSSVGNAVLTGGGRVNVTYTVQIVGASVVISGGGSVRVRTATTGTILGVRISGGGLVTANIVPISGSVVIHGGGRVIAEGQGVRVAVIHGGGSPRVTVATTGTIIGVRISGGGAVKVNVREGTAVLSGGGQIAIIKRKNVSTNRTSNRRAAAGLVYLFGGADSALVIHGGGTVTGSGAPELGTATIHGGGRPTATGAKTPSRNVVVTGGGLVRVTGTRIAVHTASVHGGGSLVTTYTRSGAISKDMVARYDLRALARRNLLVMYDLAEINAVGANLLINYDLLGLANESLVARYDLRTPINRDLIAKYDLRVPISVDLVTLYDYRALAAMDLIAAYITIGRLKRDFIAVYDVKPLVDDIHKGYAVMSRRG